MINVCIYEDRGFEKLVPLSTNQPVYTLKVGHASLFEKIHRAYHFSNITLHCRPYLKGIVKRLFPNYSINQVNTGAPCLFINGRVVYTRALEKTLSKIDAKQSHVFTKNGHIVAAYLRGDLLTFMSSALQDTPNSKELLEHLRKKTIVKECDHAQLIEYPWDLLALNEQCLVSDFRKHNQPGIIKGHLNPFTSLSNENNIFIDKGTIIEDFVLINADNGPVYIEENVRIEAHSRLEGPLYIGKNTHILGGKIKACSIGPHCKIAGEISHSIVFGYSNKAHAGFVGHSILGHWVNLGAYTTTSNLKNTYSPIKMQTNNGDVQTDDQFIGAIIGDHVKTGIHTTFNTGTIVGFGSTVFDTGFHDKHIPDFSWGSPGNYGRHELDKLLQTAERVMQRRDVRLTDTQKELFHYLYHQHSVSAHAT